MGKGDGVGFLKHNDQKHQATKLDRPKIMRRANDLYIATINPLVWIPLCIPHPRGFHRQWVWIC